MSFLKICWDRAYINLSETYNELENNFKSLDLMDLIKTVAKANPFGDGDIQLYDADTHKYFERRTKKFIVQKTKAFLLGLSQRFSPEENMATFVSLRQLKKLIYAFQENNKHISCYGLVYLYIIYTLLYGKSPKANECLNYIDVLYTIVSNYFEANPDDQLAEFFYGCYTPIYRAIRSQNTMLQNNQLPAVPRNRPQEEE